MKRRQREPMAAFLMVWRLTAGLVLALVCFYVASVVTDSVLQSAALGRGQGSSEPVFTHSLADLAEFTSQAYGVLMSGLEFVVAGSFMAVIVYAGANWGRWLLRRYRSARVGGLRAWGVLRYVDVDVDEDATVDCCCCERPDQDGERRRWGKAVVVMGLPIYHVDGGVNAYCGPCSHPLHICGEEPTAPDHPPVALIEDIDAAMTAEEAGGAA